MRQARQLPAALLALWGLLSGELLAAWPWSLPPGQPLPTLISPPDFVLTCTSGRFNCGVRCAPEIPNYQTISDSPVPPNTTARLWAVNDGWIVEVLPGGPGWWWLPV